MKTAHRSLCMLAALLPGLLLPLPGRGATDADDPAGVGIRAFSEAFAGRHGGDADAIERLIEREASHQPAIIEAITTPAEALAWHRYRGIFLTDERIRAGVAFKRRHQQWLDAMEAEYGVPADIVVAIIGVETFYGRYTGDHRVIDALRTLGFGYPPRAAFFRDELEAFLLLAREAGIDARSARGSYAGAMGIPQFIASSYRAYAVDFNDNGRRDLFSEPADAIGSIGHYLARHGWQAQAPIAVPAAVRGDEWRAYRRESLEPVDSVGTLAAAGVHPERALASGLSARLLALQAGNGPRYWVTLHNFYAITRYNHSARYAMAVHQLAGAIRDAGA